MFDQFLAAAYCQLVATIVTRPDVQGGTPVAVPAKRPVLEVVQKISESPVLHVAWVPTYLLVVPDDFVLFFGCLHVPRVQRKVQKRRIAPPAKRIFVFVGLVSEEDIAFLQVLDDVVVSVFDELALGKWKHGGEFAVQVERL